jgi:anti-sigma regulatory factor (Ser/Thr protein kinase)
MSGGTSVFAPQARPGAARAAGGGIGTVAGRLATRPQSGPPVPVSPPQQPQGMSMADQWPLRDFIELGPWPTAVPCARLRTRQVLWEWGLKEFAESVELLVSELVTNAIAACASSLGPVGLWLLSDGKQVVILVSDSAPNPPVPMNPDSATEGGRGLLLVEAVSARWGWYPIPGGTGKVVWAICS